jgi:hypothetical protein
MVFDRRRRGWLRGLTGLVVAYALILQAFLAISLASQAAAQDPAAASGSLFVLCSHEASADAQAGGAPPNADHTHCPDCTLAACAGALVPEPLQPAVAPRVAAQCPVPQTGSFVAFFSPRAGLSRAPPQNA